MKRSLQRAVRQRARGRCEYCQLPEEYAEEPFAADHIIAHQHRGPTTFENLAFACAWCNRHKGPNLSGFDVVTGRVTDLYHPRRDRWEDHFRWDGPVLQPLTPIGRVTIYVLSINDSERAYLRSLLMELGAFPPFSA